MTKAPDDAGTLTNVKTRSKTALKLFTFGNGSRWAQQCAIPAGVIFEH